MRDKNAPSKVFNVRVQFVGGTKNLSLVRKFLEGLFNGCSDFAAENALTIPLYTISEVPDVGGDDSVRFAGLDVEIPDDMNPTILTLVALHRVQKIGHAVIELDDSPEAIETEKQLCEIAGNVGFLFTKDNDSRIIIVNGEDSIS